MLYLSAVLAIIVTLLLVVGLHELGHLLAARCCNVTIKRFSIGFGRPLLMWTGKTGIEWVWAIWPLGGYVRLLNTRSMPVSSQDKSYAFDKQYLWKKIVILLSGVLANLLLAWLAFVLIFTLGYQQKPPIIASIQPHSLAMNHLSAGDQLMSIAGRETSSWREVGMQLIMHWGKPAVNVEVMTSSSKRRSVMLDLSSRDFSVSGSLLKAVGIQPLASVKAQQVRGTSIVLAMQRGAGHVVYFLSFFCIVIKQLLSATIPFSVLLGPVGMLSEMINSFHHGLITFFWFIASLSLAVACVNILPVPGLDGASIVYALVEKATGKPVSIRMEVLLYRLAFIFLCVLLVQLLMNDLRRYLHVM